MFRRRSKAPPRGNKLRSGRLKNGGNWKKSWTPGYKNKANGHNGPANNTIPEIKNHYFDCSSIHDADIYITTMKAIISYLGTQYGGDISTTLENLKDYEPPPPIDPVTKYKYVDIYCDEGSTIINLTKDQIIYSQQKEISWDIQIYTYIFILPTYLHRYKSKKTTVKNLPLKGDPQNLPAQVPSAQEDAQEDA